MIPVVLFFDNFIARSIGYSPIFLDKIAHAKQAQIGFLDTVSELDFFVSNNETSLHIDTALV